MKKYEKFNIIKELSEIKEDYISTTDMNNSKYVKDTLEFEEWSDIFLAKEENYKPNTYYHLNTKNQKPYSGVGNGLYLGRDLHVLELFYDIDEEGLTHNTYIGKPNWFFVMKEDNFIKMKNIFKKYNQDILNSNILPEVFLEMGYDGIKYYDVMATGEEYVLFNQKILKQI